MANKSVLMKSLSALIETNSQLRTKISETNNNAKISQYKKEIAKNDSLILDYKYRLQHE